tara:strand:- start:189 stop:713 length:525 start_codon:yes stop_codon:yes gene_type:complete
MLKLKENLKTRTSIMMLQELLLNGIETGEVEDGADLMPLEHFFTPMDKDYGCCAYGRQIFMPKGMVVAGALHKKAHLTFLMQGTILVVSEDGGKRRLKGPLTFVSPAGEKRSFYIEEDTTLVCVHLTKHTTEDDLDAIEDEVLSPSYEAMGLEEPDLKGLKKFLNKQTLDTDKE